MLENFLEKVVCGMPEGETREHMEMLEIFAMLAEKDPEALEAALGELIIQYRNDAEKALPLLDTVAFGVSERKEFIQSIFARAGLSEANAAKLLARLRTGEDRRHANGQLERKRK